MKNYYLEQMSILEKKDAQAFATFNSHMQVGTAKKGEMLLTLHSTCKNICILEAGWVRHFRIDKHGREFNAWFSFEGEVVTAMESFVTQEPSSEGMEIMEDCKYYYLSRQDLIALIDQYHPIESFYRQMIEFYYIEVERRLYRMQVYTAKQKYEYLLENKPHFLMRIPQIHIASFLGIAKETLSRIRTNK